MQIKIRLWSARVLISIVVFFNLQCSLAFLLTPEKYAPSFNLIDLPGIYMIQGLGLLFLMWNVPYLVALFNPQKHFIALIESIIMQAIGVVGESILLTRIPSGYALLHNSVTRFILFDASGLFLLFTALLLSWMKMCPSKP